MFKTILCSLILSFSLLHLQSFAQKLVPTTEEEYNYITKGYKIQVSSGLDMKKGYHFNQMGKLTEGIYHFDYKFLVRDDNNSVAGILVVINAKYILGGLQTYYICVPVGQQMIARFSADMENIKDANLLRAYSKLVSVIMADSFSGFYSLKGHS
jgi:hypothetical protein